MALPAGGCTLTDWQLTFTLMVTVCLIITLAPAGGTAPPAHVVGLFQLPLACDTYTAANEPSASTLHAYTLLP